MSPAQGAFSQTLQTITTTKLEELSKKRTTFDTRHQAVLLSLQNQDEPLVRLRTLIAGVKKCFDIQTGIDSYAVQSGGNADLAAELRLIARFAEQADFDPSITAERITGWENTLHRYLEVQNVRYRFATLYGQLVTEWLESEQDFKSKNIDMDDAFEEVPQAKKLEARAVWERDAFEPFELDEAELNTYLHTLFGQTPVDETEDLKKAFQEVRKAVSEFDGVFAGRPFDTNVLQWVIKGLTQGDLLDNEKRTVLKDFLRNPIVLSEIVDVLNMRMAALDSWSWGAEVIVEERRKITGLYNMHLREDLLQAIFLQFIGIRWSVFLKQTLRTFRSTKGVWKSSEKNVPKEDKRRRAYYLGRQSKHGSIQKRRMKMYRTDYLLVQLPDTEYQQVETAEGEEEAEIEEDDAEAELLSMPMAKKKAVATRMASDRMRQLPMSQAYSYTAAHQEDEDDGESSSDENFGQPKNPMELKQNLLHLVSAEIEINKHLHGEQTVFKSVFQDWNPLLPHTTILKVLEFFGVSSKWLTFFRKFLEAPLRFMDDRNGTRTRKRGIPGSHSLSDFFGELILFNLDFAVNQATDGAILWRMHDEFWFWSPRQEVCTTAWRTVTRFSKAMGVNLNEEKTGGVRISSENGKLLAVGTPLPTGTIRWGFLYLGRKSGRFEIDQGMIDHHIKQLQKQLRDKRSIFAWIQAFNTYATTFFTTNFGKTATCFGREHVDKILSTHKRVHREVFPQGGVVQYLKDELKRRFGIKDIPDGFLYFPIELGGLNLQNPFIEPLQIRNSTPENPSELVSAYLATEKATYREQRESFDTNVYLAESDWKPAKDSDVFMPFDEYTRYRAEYDPRLGHLFDSLLARPSPQPVQASPDIEAGLLKSLDSSRETGGLSLYFDRMDPYWKWIAQQYGREMMEMFGEFTVVEAGLLPTGMVSLFRDKRVSWEG